MLSTGGTQREGTCLFISNNNQPRAFSFGRFSFQHNNILLYHSHFRTRKPQIGPSEVCLHAQLFVKRKSANCHICVLRAKISTSKSIKCPNSNEKESLASLEEAFENALRVVWDRKPKGYWSSIELIEKYDSIPSTAELRERKKSSLIKAIADFGGRKVLADVMGLRARKMKFNQPTFSLESQEYYFDKEKRDLFERLKCLREALSIISFRKYGVLNRIPSMKALERMRLSTVIKEIEELGGIARVASLINFKIGEKDFDEVACELLQIGASLGYRFPTMKELNQMGRSDLRRAVSLYGGVSVVAQRIGLRVLVKAGRPLGDHSARKPQRLWSNEKLLKALREFQKDTTVLPSAKELVAVGRFDILYQIRVRGGHRKAACQLGLKSRRRGKCD